MDPAEFLRGYLADSLPERPGKIPWSDPAFSERMLREHLSQEHDRASRRAAVVDQETAWIDSEVLRGRPSRVLDLGCGPGLYCSRLARLGHRCVGIDFSPASVRYAREQAARDGLDCEYVEADLVGVEFGSDYDLVMMINGELSTFPLDTVREIMMKCAGALNTGGMLLLEIHRPEWVRRMAGPEKSWRISARGLFSDGPHLVLGETAWDEARGASIQTWHVLEPDRDIFTSYRSSTYLHEDAEISAGLEAAGLRSLRRYPALRPGDAAQGEDMYVLLAGRA